MAQNEELVSFEVLAKSLAGIKSPVEALGAAQQLELRARDFYASLASRSRNPSMKSIFEFLAREEQRHYERLAAWKSHLNGETAAPGVGDRQTAGGWDRDVIPKELTPTEQEVLLEAQRAENTSYQFYVKMASVHRKGQLADVFNELAGEEKKHVELIEWIYGEETRFRLET